MTGLLQKAVQTGNKFDMIYLDAHNQVSQRMIRIWGVKETYVTAYCFTRQCIRTFKRDRILSINPIECKSFGA